MQRYHPITTTHTNLFFFKIGLSEFITPTKSPPWIFFYLKRFSKVIERILRMHAQERSKTKASSANGVRTVVKFEWRIREERKHVRFVEFYLQVNWIRLFVPDIFIPRSIDNPDRAGFEQRASRPRSEPQPITARRSRRSTREDARL